MKRYLVLILTLALLLPCLTVPASATGAYDENISENVEIISGDLYDWFLQWYAYFMEATETVNDVSGTEALVTPFEKDLIEVQMYVWSWISDVFDTISTTLTTIKNGVANIYATINSYFRTWGNYFISMLQYLQQLVNGSDVSQGTADEIQGDVDADSTEASEMLDIMDDVTKPDEGELEDLADISGYVDAGDVSVLAACLSPLFTSAVFLPCIMLSLIFMLVAYVLYGKR